MRALVACRTGLRAAVLLARGHADAIRLLDVGPADEPSLATQSFWAAVVCLPAFAAMRALDWADAGGSAAIAHSAALDLLGYFVGWAGFALLSHRIAAMLGRTRRWRRFITAWNWCNVLQYLLLLTAMVPPLLGLPVWITETAWLFAMGWALWLEWFATRAALEIPGAHAAGLVMLDLMIGLFVAGVVGSTG